MITTEKIMTYEELKNYYKTGYRFHKGTGMSQNSFLNWRRKGFIPIESQIKIQNITNFDLKANIDHIKK